MATSYPIVRLKREPRKGARIKGRKPYFPKKIPYQQQIRRLGTVFDQAIAAVSNFEKGIEVSADPRAVVPERALVFELIGPVADFEFAAQALGLEWLISEDVKPSTDDDEAANDEDRENGIPPASWLYLTMPSLQGLKKLLTQWNRYKQGKDPSPEHRALWKLFDYLKDLRVWSAKDRIDPSIDRYVRAVLENEPNSDVLVEIDLWYRTETERRDNAVHTLEDMLQAVGGEMLDLIHIAEIRYQGALVKVPAHVALRLAEGEGRLATLDDVMTIRPQSSYSSKTSPFEAPEMPELEEAQASDKRRIAVLLDGYPVSGHAALDGRLTVHEVEVSAVQAPVGARFHGTAMASLVLHGDLHSSPGALDHHLVVVPVLTGAANGGESTPVGKLPIGVIYNSLKHIVESKHPDLANIAVVNHSLCDTYSPFVRRPSPWAALLDYFSHHHRLLFVVSAGNISSTFHTNEFADLAAFHAAGSVKQQAVFLDAVQRAKGTRGLLSPAESVNSLTIGALHADGAPAHSGAVIDPYPTVQMTNLASAVGLGVNRSLKPDMVEHGGRFAAGCTNMRGGGLAVHAKATAELGHLVAAPSPNAGDLRQVMRTAGTSNAAALVTRSCLQVADAVEGTYQAEGVDWLTLPTRIPILKALVTHGCEWGSIGDILEAAYPPVGAHSWSPRRENISRFLGYGRPNPERIVTGTDNRITLLADDVIQHDALHRFEIPLPTSMLNTREVRSITITLAWTTPVIFTSADYRGVGLKLVDEDGKRDFWDGVGRVLQPNVSTAEHGTLIHFILQGTKLKKAAKGSRIVLCVQAAARHSSQLRADIPYALAVTLEVAQAQRTGLYAEVRDAIRTRVAARATVRV